ncbi:cell division protein FtsQ [Orenia metallireducens]|uniref:Cell division protein FtsQ n=1 Tax=Orenia metallireducens TaxID=1413210 RepID=A0A285GVJ6_9FIRM|nr:cell division protein FtsQ/DivIB [Orenia metallireducens]PRX31111.1 cell division protein FtsQ [Orenia metallireducens]SNY27532.1 cell division protein FtsQ [Orenia metallireducens]
MDKHKTIYLITIGLLLILGLVSLVNSNYFQVEDIEIEGNKLLSDEYIITYCDLEDINIFNIDRQKLANKLVELPQIKGVVITRDLPKKLIIEVNERRPIAIVGIQSSYQIIDSEGQVIATTKNLAYWNLPLVTGVEVINDGKQLKISSEIKKAISYLGMLSDQLLKDISELNISKGDGLQLFLVDGGIVKLSSNFDNKAKSKIFTSVYNDLKSKGQKIEYIDLRYGNNVIVHLAK